MHKPDQPQAEPRAADDARAPLVAMSAPALIRRAGLSIGLALLFAAAAAGFSMTLPDRYTAIAKVLVDPRGFSAAAQPASGPPAAEAEATFLETQARIVASPEMLRRIVDREGLAGDPEFAGAKGVLSRLFAPAGDMEQAQRIAEELSRNVQVSPGDRPFVLDIAVAATTPEKAARIANALAAAYLEDQANARADIARRTTGSLSMRLDEIRERIRRSEEKIEASRNQRSAVGASGRLASEERLTALGSQLAFARSRSADARARFERIDSLRGETVDRGAIPESLSSQTLGIRRERLAEATRRAGDLTKQLGPAHPDLLAAQSALREAQRDVAEEIGRIRSNARSEYDRAIANERALAAQIEALKRQALPAGREAGDPRELERQLEADRAVYNSLLQRARDTGHQQQGTAEEARIIAAAAPPTDVSGPSRQLIVAGGAFGGLALGVLAAAVSGFAQSIRSKPATPLSEPLPQAEEELSPEEWAPVENHPPSAQAPSHQPSLSSEELEDMLELLKTLEWTIRRHGLPQ